MADTEPSSISTEQCSLSTGPDVDDDDDDDDDECLPGVDEDVRLWYRWMTLPPIRCQNFVIRQ